MQLPRSTPAEQGIDPRGIDRFLDNVAGHGIELHSLMLLRRGNVVAEGWWAPYAPDRVHLLYSLSKSFASTAIGLAVAEGRLSVDDPVVSFFPDAVPDDASPHLLAMRVHHLLCMGTGHQLDTTGQIFGSGDDPVRAFFRFPPDQEPGTVFAYNSTATFMLSAIITAVTGERLTDYLRPRLFDPLGIDEAYWHARNSIDIGFSGLHVTTESIAKLGQLYLQRGRWGDRQLVPESWVEAATANQIATVTPWRQNEPLDWQQGYGYQFWRCRHNAFRGDGAYGQFSLVIPDSDVVLAITSATGDMQAILDAAWDCLLPTLDTRDAEPAESVPLQDRSLQLPTVDGSAGGPDAGPWKFGSAVPESERGWRFPDVSELTVTPEGDAWSVRFDADPDIACGHRTWAESTVERMPVAASGGWTGPGVFEVDLIFLDTPHHLLIRCDTGSSTFGLSWSTDPLHGGSFQTLAAPRS